MAIELGSINLGDIVFFTTTNRLGELDVSSGEVEEKNEKASGKHSVVVKIQEEGMDDFFHSRSLFTAAIFTTAELAVAVLEGKITEAKAVNILSLAKVKVKYNMAASKPVAIEKS
jgi:hypothetical protein